MKYGKEEKKEFPLTDSEGEISSNVQAKRKPARFIQRKKITGAGHEGRFTMGKKRRNRIVEIIDQITPDQGVFILRKLWSSSPDVRMKIETEIKKELKAVDYNEVASEVQSSLDMLEEDELYDRSGPSRNGYHSPDDMAVIMVEEALETYQEQLKRYFEMGMYKEAMEYCKGILKGLYEYEKNSNSKFSEWARDVPIEMFGWILREWKKKNKEKSYKVEIDEFITKECNEWSDHKD